MFKKLRQFFCMSKIQICIHANNNQDIEIVEVFCTKCGKLLDKMTIFKSKEWDNFKKAKEQYEKNQTS